MSEKPKETESFPPPPRRLKRTSGPPASPTKPKSTVAKIFRARVPTRPIAPAASSAARDRSTASLPPAPEPRNTSPTRPPPAATASPPAAAPPAARPATAAPASPTPAPASPPALPPRPSPPPAPPAHPKPIDRAVELLGGYDKIDSTILHYHPGLYFFTTNTAVKRLVDRPSKGLLALLGLALMQAVIPLAAYPLNELGRWITAWFMTYHGRKALYAGTALPNSPLHACSMLIMYLVVSGVEISQKAIQIATGDFSPPLWSPLLVPLVVLWHPSGSMDTVGSRLARMCAPVASQSAAGLSVDVKLLLGDNEAKAVIALVSMGMYRYTTIGATVIPLAIWTMLATETIKTLSALQSAEPDAVMAAHHLIAVFLWRLVVGAIETVPLLGRAREATIYGVPWFYAAVGLFFAAMFMAGKSVEEVPSADPAVPYRRANAWYARVWV